MKGLYLVQPSILLQTDRYKFGISYNLDRRIYNYGKKTLILYRVFSIINPTNIENLLKIFFKKYIYCGNEYIQFENLQLLKIKFEKFINSCNIIYKKINKINFNVLIFVPKYENKIISKSKIISKPKIIAKPKNIIIHEFINNNGVNYICLRCNKNFGKFKTHLTNHLSRKFTCKVIHRNFENDFLIQKLNLNEYLDFYETCSKEHKCPFCDKYYKHKNSISRHKKTCKNNPEKYFIENIS